MSVDSSTSDLLKYACEHVETWFPVQIAPIFVSNWRNLQTAVDAILGFPIVTIQPPFEDPTFLTLGSTRTLGT